MGPHNPSTILSSKICSIVDSSAGIRRISLIRHLVSHPSLSFAINPFSVDLIWKVETCAFESELFPPIDNERGLIFHYSNTMRYVALLSAKTHHWKKEANRWVIFLQLFARSADVIVVLTSVMEEKRPSRLVQFCFSILCSSSKC